MQIEIPELCVVALIGATGSGKSTFAEKHFKKTEVLSSDFFRGLISDDENNQEVTPVAFDSLYYIANKRLEAGKLTVIDATNVQKNARNQVVKLAKEQNCLAVAIVLDYPVEICQANNEKREGRNYPLRVIQNHTRDLKRSLKHLKKEGFRYIYVLHSPEEAEEVEIIRTKLWNDKKEETGPFDLIGDIHGCYDELCALLTKLDYKVDSENCTATPPDERKAVFLGDLCDRGPKNVEVLRLVMNMTEAGQALCIPGNHDVKLLKYLRSKKVSLTHGLDTTVAQLEEESEEFRQKVSEFLDGLISHYVLDDGNLVVAHAGLKEKYHGRGSGRVRQFCLYGETTGETDEFGLPVRHNWAEEYRGKALVVYGHTPALEVQSKNNTLCLDTGCVFGGKLTAYQYPEKNILQVKALKQYYDPIKPLEQNTPVHDDMLNIKDVLGKRFISPSIYQTIKIEEENTAAALEVMSRFASDPHWLIYLPPTMSPCETSKLPDYLEHPLEAFDYYRTQGIQTVVCEQKHMGSRAVIVLCKDIQTAKVRFGVEDGTIGLIYTRTGRHFFEEAQRKTETEILQRLQAVLNTTGFWEAYATNWICLDTELMPWSAKAQKLLIDQYAPAGRAGQASLKSATAALEKAVQRQAADEENSTDSTVKLDAVLAHYQARSENLDKYVAAYRQYCWQVNSIEDYRIAPFHILATEGKVWDEETHLTHMAVIKKYMTGLDSLFMATNHMQVDLADEVSVKQGVDWWLSLTASGGEGMVVKPLNYIAYDKKGKLIQPAVKCRGREYLRIIYGPEYTMEAHLPRLKSRSLGKKRRLALSEFSLGLESLKRFVAKEPLYKTHECVFAVLAMESEPVDPRL